MLTFTELLQTNPSYQELSEWNFDHMMACANSGDAHNASVFATEVVRWALVENGWKRNWLNAPLFEGADNMVAPTGMENLR